MSKFTVYGEADVNGVIKGLKQCEKEAKQLEGSLKLPGSKEALRQLQEQISDVGNKLEATTKSASAFSSKLSSATMAVGKMALGAVSIAAITSELKRATDESIKFERKLSELKALTGSDFSGDSKAIIDIAKKNSTNSSAVVDAMKIVGSQRAELLSDKEALMRVTDAANTLANASLMSVEESASAITTTMNQMGVEAKEADEIINAFAASSKAGAADVNYLKTVMEKAGTQAKSMGLEFHDVLAITEAVAGNFSSADVAGSQLNSTLLKLGINAEEQFNPSMVGMKKALDNLAEAELSDLRIKKLVGESNITMLKALIKNRDAYADIKKQIVGSNEAFLQMDVIGDNTRGSIEKLSSSWDAFMLNLMNGQNVVNTMVKTLNSLVSSLDELVNRTSSKKTADLKNQRLDLLEEEAAWVRAKKEVAQMQDFVSKNPDNDFAKQELARLEKIERKLRNIYYGVKETEGSVMKKAEKAVTPTVTEDTSKTKPLYYGEDTEEGLKNLISKYTKIRESSKIGSDKRDDAIKEVERLENLYKEATADKVKEKLAKNVTEAKEALVEGSIGALRAKIAEIGKQIEALEGVFPKDESAINTTLLEDAKAMKQELERALSQLTQNVYKDGSTAYYEQLISNLEDEKDLVEVNSAKYHQLNAEIESLQKQMANGDKLYAIESERFGDIIEKLQQQRKSLSENSQEWIKMGAAIDYYSKKQQQAKLNETTEQLSNLNSTAKIAGQTMQEYGNKTVASFGKVLTTVAEAIVQMYNLFASQTAAALSEGLQEASKQPYPANLVAYATTASSIVSAIMAVKGVAKFAEGGIVGGGTPFGDYQTVRVNSGEMILNGSQQRRLFNALNHEGGFGQNNSKPQQLTFKVSGTDLVTVLNNYNTKFNK